jgi:hypothetical protein
MKTIILINLGAVAALVLGHNMMGRTAGHIAREIARVIL